MCRLLPLTTMSKESVTCEIGSRGWIANADIAQQSWSSTKKPVDFVSTFIVIQNPHGLFFVKNFLTPTCGLKVKATLRETVFARTFHARVDAMVILMQPNRHTPI